MDCHWDDPTEMTYSISDFVNRNAVERQKFLE